MAKVTQNIIINGITGQLGKQIVFRTRYGKTFISTMPVFRKKPTGKQLEQRERFKKAAEYAKEVKANPELLAWYRSITPKGYSVNSIIIREWMKGNLELTIKN